MLPVISETDITPYTFAFLLEPAKGGRLVKGGKVVSYRSVNKHQAVHNLPKSATLIRNTMLSDVKAWVATLKQPVYTCAYADNMLCPGDLYQLVYITVPPGFRVRNSSEEITTKINRLSQMIRGGNEVIKAPSVVNTIEGGIEGVYGETWADQLSKDELMELFDC